MLHLQLSPNHVLIYSLNLVTDVKDFTLEGSWFHIFGPKVIRLLSPYFGELRCLTRMSKGLILGSLLGVNMSFHETRINIIVLKISIAKVRNLLISFVAVLLFFNKVV